MQTAIGVDSRGPLAEMISALGLLGVVGWVGWRFGPTLLRLSGWSSFWTAWAIGGERGYGYCVAFVVLGSLLWGGGTFWYVRRRGRWPSALSRRIMSRVPGGRSLVSAELPSASVVSRRQP
jgi:hypothetical protein